MSGSAHPDSGAGASTGDAGAGTSTSTTDAADDADVGGVAWADGIDADADTDNPTSDDTNGDVDDQFGTGAANDDPDDGGVDDGSVDDAVEGADDAATVADQAETTESSPDGDDSADGAAEPVEGDTGSPTTSDDELSVENLVEDLERVTAERDQYLDASRRVQAEFENYKKAVQKREVEARERANESLVAEILPVLDACDGAVASGASDVEPVRTTLLGALSKQGLERIEAESAAFDPSVHEAVMHEPDDDGEGPRVAEVMRAGYRWKGRVVRPAMVRVRG